MMKNIFLLVALLGGMSFSVKAADTVSVRETRIPVLIDRYDNELFHLRLDAKEIGRASCRERV